MQNEVTFDAADIQAAVHYWLEQKQGYRVKGAPKITVKIPERDRPYEPDPVPYIEVKVPVELPPSSNSNEQ